jgi:hypothetical protein
LEPGGDEIATQQPILLMTLNSGKEVRSTEYDCAPSLVLNKVQSAFVAAWAAISDSARGILEEHWDDGMPVTLVWESRDWAKPNFGFATTGPGGKSMFCWSEVLKDIPHSVLVTTFAHEMGHMAFIAIAEPAHAEKKNKEAEYLIAELLPEWMLNQQEADLWLIENFNDYESPLERRENPLSKELLEPRRKDYQKKMQNAAPARAKYRASVQKYFDRVAGLPPTASANLK